MPQKLLAQHFRSPVDSEGLERMSVTSKSYSKGRKGSGKAGQFEGDSSEKEKAVRKVATEKEKKGWGGGGGG
jgi:hypothetical protein